LRDWASFFSQFDPLQPEFKFIVVDGDLFEDHHRPALGLALSKYPSLNWR
jgi:hypothetical protein